MEDEKKEKQIPDAKWFSSTRRFGENTLGNFLRSHCPGGGSVASVSPGWTKLSRFRNGGGNAAEHFHVVGGAQPATGKRRPDKKRRYSNHRETNGLCSFVSSAPCSASKDGTRRALEDRLRQQLRASDVIGQKRRATDV